MVSDQIHTIFAKKIIMNSRKSKEKPEEDAELKLLIDRIDSENAALSKILNRLRPTGKTQAGSQKTNSGEK